jgi:hypothetical protein
MASTPVGTRISADNLGSDAIHLVAIFSASGFEDFMRETSAGEGEKMFRCLRPKRMASRKSMPTR